MYRGFNLELGNINLSEFVEEGRTIHDKNKLLVEEKIDSFKDKNGNLRASEIIAKWFPPIDADVFLSHSHKDEEQVIALAGWLHKKFGLTSFIDSCIWGYSVDLLKIIDDKYCYNSSSKMYDYEKRNRSTSHIYMMLSTALAKMINSCECIMFVNTPNSISPGNYIGDETTDSPWIYSEIAMTSIVQKRTPDDHRNKIIKHRYEIAAESFSESLNVEYDVDLTHLTPLKWSDLISWQSKNTAIGATSLNNLYRLKRQSHD